MVANKARPLRWLLVLALFAGNCVVLSGQPPDPEGTGDHAHQSATAVGSGQGIFCQPQTCQVGAHVHRVLWQKPQRHEHVPDMLSPDGRRPYHCAWPMASHWSHDVHAVTVESDGITHTHQDTPRPAPVDVPMIDENPPIRERPLQSLTAQQLRQAISRLERHILDLPQDSYGPLRAALEDNLAQTRAELLARKPEGQALEQAVAKHKQAQKVLQLAEQNRDRARESLRLAEDAYQQTKLAEESAAQEVHKQRLAISEFETARPPIRAVPSETLDGLYQILQQVRPWRSTYA